MRRPIPRPQRLRASDAATPSTWTPARQNRGKTWRVMNWQNAMCEPMVQMGVRLASFSRRGDAPSSCGDRRGGPCQGRRSVGSVSRGRGGKRGARGGGSNEGCTPAHSSSPHSSSSSPVSSEDSSNDSDETPSEKPSVAPSHSV